MTLFAVFLLIFSQFFAIFLCFLFVRRWINSQKTALLDLAKAYFESPGDNKPSQFGQFVDLTAQTFASRIMQSARAQLANMSSLNTRQGKSIEAHAIEDGLPGALGAIPGIGKMIQKNPILGLAAQFVASKLSGVTVEKGPEHIAHSNGGSPFSL